MGPTYGNRDTRSRLVLTLSTLCVIFFVGAVGAFAWALTLRGGSQDDERHQVEQVATVLTERLWSYEPAELDKLNTAVMGQITGRFKREWEALYPELKKAVTHTQVKSAAVVKQVYSTPVEGDEANVVLVYDKAVSNQRGERRSKNLYVRMGLLRVGGDWKVNEVLYLSRGGSGQSAAAAPQDRARR